MFHGGPHTLGFLMTRVRLRRAGRRACGWRSRNRWSGSAAIIVDRQRALFGVGLIAFSLTPVLWLAIPCLVVAGFGFMVQMASSNTVIQTIVDDEKRGRVMSFYMMAFLGTAPFGSLIAGWLSSRIGAPTHCRAGRHLLPRRRGLVRERAAGDPRGRAADLRQDGHSAAGRGGNQQCRGALRSAGATVGRATPSTAKSSRVIAVAPSTRTIASRARYRC